MGSPRSARARPFLRQRRAGNRVSFPRSGGSRLRGQKPRERGAHEKQPQRNRGQGPRGDVGFYGRAAFGGEQVRHSVCRPALQERTGRARRGRHPRLRQAGTERGNRLRALRGASLHSLPRRHSGADESDGVGDRRVYTPQKNRACDGHFRPVHQRTRSGRRRGFEAL